MNDAKTHAIFVNHNAQSEKLYASVSVHISIVVRNGTAR